jgi:NADPH2:quinone reductase
MTTQTALVLSEIGRPLVKQFLPIPEPKENELLIKITSAGRGSLSFSPHYQDIANGVAVAPLDRKLRDLNAFNIGSRLPAVISADVVGTVVKGSSSFPIGSHVFSQVIFSNPLLGALQEYTLINHLYAAVVPSGITDTEAALYPVNAVTSAMGLFTANGLNIPFPGTPESKTFDYASQKLVIIGGGSNTVKLAIQFAKIAGIGTIITTASLSSAEELKVYGATHVIARQAPDIEEQVRAIVGDELLYVYDTFSIGDISLGVSLLSNSKKGTIANILTGAASETVTAQKKAGFEAKRIVGFSHAIPEFGQMFWKEFPAWLESGKVKPLRYKVIEGLDAEKVNKALDEYRDGKGGDRYHVRIQSSGKL